MIGAINFAHFLNDMMQSLILAIYPLLEGNFHFDFPQIGPIMFTYRIAASLLRPMVRLYTDKYPKPHSSVVSMGFTLVGLVLLSAAPSSGTVLLAAVPVGTGPLVFHPESSRMTCMASGDRHGLTQLLFQVGSNAGSAVDSLLAVIAPMPYGQHSLAWLSIAALIAISALYHVNGWYKHERVTGHGSRAGGRAHAAIKLSGGQATFVMTLLVVLLSLKYFYLASLNSYYTFFLITRLHLSIQTSQLFLSPFLFSVAVGMIMGGLIGGRVGRKVVIWVSILGVVPFTLPLPYTNLFWTVVLTVIIGLILVSTFLAILVYVQELILGKVGMVPGLFFGFVFGLGGIDAAVLGKLADATGIYNVYHLCSFLSLIGLLTVSLSNIERKRRQTA